MLNIKNNLYQEDLNYAVLCIDKKLIEGKSFLITGASGLIGSFLIDVLNFYNEKITDYTKKNKIYCLARRLNKLYERFEYCAKKNNIYFIEQDICNPINDTIHFDYIIHAASNADPVTYSLYPVDTIKTNVLGTINVFEYAKKHIETKILFTSSIEVYGKSIFLNSNNEESYGLIDFNDIRSGYPESKRLSELLCKSYEKQYNINYVITRLGYIYGPSMTSDDSKVIAQFINKALKNENIILKSNGDQVRSYCYVADAISGMIYSLLYGKNMEVYNIANKESILSIKEIAELTAKITNTKVIYEFPNEIEKQGFFKSQNSIMDETKLVNLGWSPKYDMESGLRRTIKILKNNI